MNKTQLQLVKFLSFLLTESKIEENAVSKINWKQLIQESEAHQINTLVYYAIRKTNYLDKIDTKLLSLWKQHSFLSCIAQIEHINQIEKVMNRFNEKNIPVIVLKGLVIRGLYPKPELRTMCDADILVKKEDINKARKLLIQEGYTERIDKSPNEAHIVFEHEKYPPIEVHWRLVGEGYKWSSYLEDSVWKNIMYVQIGKCRVLSLNYEIFTLFHCIHMLKHFMNSGISIRQLFDLVLIVQEWNKLIKWGELLEISKSCKVEKFIIALFKVCEELFQMEIPKCFNEDIKFSKIEIKLLIEDIIGSPVFNRKDITFSFKNRVSKKIVKDNQTISSSGCCISLFFPSSYQLDERYKYAKKIRILLPIAWIHRLIIISASTKYSNSDKIKLFMLMFHISKKRHKLCHMLDLKNGFSIKA